MLTSISLNISNKCIFLKKVYNFLIWKVKSIFLWEYYYNIVRNPKIRSAEAHYDPQIHKEVLKELEKNKFEVIDFKIDIADYKAYMKKAKYNIYPKYIRGFRMKNPINILIEKSLEHYLATKFLNLSNDDIYIDIANNNSPVPEIYQKLFGCNVYRQDLIFRKGIHHENIIGGDASKMPVKNGFATKMALHCSFEHFERDSDIRFIKEVSRVLRKGGRLCVLPLYLSNKYTIQTDPAFLNKKDIFFEEDAIIYCVKGSRIRHSRFYDVPHLITRIRNNMNDLKLTIYIVQNEKEVHSSCYIKFIALFEKK